MRGYDTVAGVLGRFRAHPTNVPYVANTRKKKGGRTTPPGRTSPPSKAKPSRRGGILEGPAQPGKRPSNPAFLFVVGLVWIACGVYAIVALDASWKFIPGIFFIGVGILFLRGAAVTVIRRGDRS